LARAAKDCDVIFNCAHDFGSNKRHWPAAVEGARNVASAALTAGVRRLVHTSTFAVYGNTAAGPLIETTPWRPPDHPYREAKQQGERILKQLHQSEGLPVAVVQPTIVYGPHSKVWTEAPVQALKRGLVALADGGHGFCNAVYVDDVVQALLRAAIAADVDGRSYLISGAEPVTWADFYGAYEEILGLDATIGVESARVAALERSQRRTLRRMLGNDLAGTIAQWAQEPDNMSALKDLRSVQRAILAVKDHVSEERWQSIKRRATARARGGAAAEQREMVQVPDKTALALQTSRTHVRIDRAREELGFEPNFDLARGMKLTGEWLRWARLV
jgi:nucleoside-diphosphate-sugar epimerase